MSFVRLSQSMEAVQLFPEEGKRQTVCSAGTAGIVDVLKVPACNFLNHGTVAGLCSHNRHAHSKVHREGTRHGKKLLLKASIPRSHALATRVLGATRCH